MHHRSGLPWLLDVARGRRVLQKIAVRLGASRWGMPMTAHNVYAGEATYRVGSRVRRFRPKGKLHDHSKRQGAVENPVKRLSGGGYSARLFVGLNVGQTQRYDEDDVVDIVWKTRKKQGALADASILTQKGIYEDRSGALVTEPSVQVIIIDLSGAAKKAFVGEMQELAETLRRKMRQETVILEIQRKGTTVDVYSVTR
jgi:hypothetical protein